MNWQLINKFNSNFRHLSLTRLVCKIIAAAFVAAALAVPATPAQKPPLATKPLSAAEFSRIMRDFSEEEGNFASDNYISNEFAYLRVLDKFKEIGVAGGAYIGVGPEQNFSYIAKIRPEIAFIVDIRREAIIQHLMYKAIFQKADDRSQFLSLLFSKPLSGKSVPGRDADIAELVSYFEQAPTSDEAYAANLNSIRTTIEKDFQVPLSAVDQRRLDHVYSAFQKANLSIFTRWASGYGYGGSPTLKDLLLETDINGNHENYLASRANYEFVRDLHRSNRIIPVVGDFAGTKALADVAGYLRDNGYVVSAFYTSNVEQYLFGSELFDNFAANVKKFPINDRSVFIRASRGGHQTNRPYYGYGFRSTLLQKMMLFVEDFDAGLYSSYGNLLRTHAIDPDGP